MADVFAKVPINVVVVNVMYFFWRRPCFIRRTAGLSLCASGNHKKQTYTQYFEYLGIGLLEVIQYHSVIHILFLTDENVYGSTIEVPLFANLIFKEALVRFLDILRKIAIEHK